MIMRKLALASTTLAVTFMASCARSQPAPETKTVVVDTNVPTLKSELVSTPVRSSRSWTTALAPNERGGWNFITQLYEYRSKAPTEWVVLDLQTGKYTVTEGPSAIYAKANERAENGRIFFTLLANNVAYYDPKDEKIKTLGQVADPKTQTMIYRWSFGPDGKLYGGTQSKGLAKPVIVRIDPDTLEHKVLGPVGDDRKSYSYAYYLAADPTPSEGAPQGWVYVAVGQTPWELAAINVATGESKVLATRADAGWMNLGRTPHGLTANLITGLRRPDQKYDKVWLADGQIFPFEPKYDAAKLPFKPRDVVAKAGPITDAPELDTTQLNADANGIGRVFWRPAGSQDEKAWKEAQFKVQHTSPIDLESLLALPDGTLLGNAVQYHGFFRYDPKEKKSTFYGAHGPSRGPRAVKDGLVYITGYPRSILYAYDPTKPWTSDRRKEEAADKDKLSEEELAALNPRKLGHFAHLTDTHYATHLQTAGNGRLYFAGRRERTGTGSGIGWYDPATKTFGGHHENLSFLKPRGLVVLDDLQRVVFSGELQNDPAKPKEKPSEAQLVVYDMELKELERLTVKSGLTHTGSLSSAPDKNQIVGVIGEAKAIYRYDLAQKKLLDWIEVPGGIEKAVRREADGSLWIVSESTLLRVDPATLQMKAVGKIEQTPDLMVWQGDKLYVTQGPDVYQIDVPL